MIAYIYFNMNMVGNMNITSYESYESNINNEVSNWTYSDINLNATYDLRSLVLVVPFKGNYVLGGAIKSYDKLTIQTEPFSFSASIAEGFRASQQFLIMNRLIDSMLFTNPFQYGYSLSGDSWGSNIWLYAYGQIVVTPDDTQTRLQPMYSFTRENIIKALMNANYNLGIDCTGFDNNSISLYEYHYDMNDKLILFEDESCKVTQEIQDNSTELVGRVTLVRADINLANLRYIDCGYNPDGSVFYNQYLGNQTVPHQDLLYPQSTKMTYIELDADTETYSRDTLVASLVKASQTITFLIKLKDSSEIRLGHRVLLKLKDGRQIDKQIIAIRRKSGSELVEVQLHG